MRIIIDSPDMTLVDLVALARWLRDRYKGEERHVNMFVASEIPVEEARIALGGVFEGDPYWTKIIDFDEGNGDK